MNRQYFLDNFGKQWETLQKISKNSTMPIAERQKEYKTKSTKIVNIPIATLGTRCQITDTIDTILTSTYSNIKLVITIQENAELMKQLKELYAIDSRVEIIYEQKNSGWIQANNHLAQQEGFLFPMADDISMTRETIGILVSEMERLFPDEDGILATNHTNTYLKNRAGWSGAFVFIGEKFMDRFPDRQVYCPDFFIYMGDIELPEYALSINKCFQIPDAHIIHYGRRAGKRDATSKRASSIGSIDHETYFLRQQKGYLWGKNFDLLKGGV
jgi:hypothetical protein